MKNLITPHEQALLEQYDDYLAYQGAQGEDESDFYDQDDTDFYDTCDQVFSPDTEEQEEQE
ncbi:hypothetical protein [Helicobacter suis]|uniref:hypothetical protein n=1 Tax=Helicobacter suis TaxID=104628 RepID=UPI0013D34248|nr:hypothetical protein [Helicobacter suis]